MAPDAATPDTGSSPDAAPAPDAAPPVVTIHTSTPPALVALRAEDSATWQTFDVAGKSEFRASVTGPYRVVVVCTPGRTVRPTEYARTPADGPDLTHTCAAPGSRPFTVSGEVEESGEAFIASGGRGSGRVPWTFALSAPAGTFDFTVLFGELSAEDRIAIRRDVVVAADVDLGKLDAAGMRAEALVPITFTATNKTPDEALAQSTTLDTATGQVSLRSFGSDPDGGWDTVLVPADLLRATDRQTVFLQADTHVGGAVNRTLSRGVNREVRAGDPTEVTLPAPLAGEVRFDMAPDRMTATLPPVPAQTSAQISQFAFSEDFEHFWDHNVFLSSSFIAATGITTGVVDFRGVPGFLDEWRIDLALEVQRGVSLSHDTSPTASAFASVNEDIVPAPALHRAPAAQRARAAQR